MTIQSTPDILDRLAGIAQGSALDALRRQRPETRGNVQASYEALFEAADETGAPSAERLAVASFVALLHGDTAATEHYLGRLAGLPEGAARAALVRRQAERAAARGPYGAYPPGPLSREDTAGPIFTVAATDRATLGERAQRRWSMSIGWSSIRVTPRLRTSLPCGLPAGAPPPS